MRRLAALVVSVVAVALAGCGGTELTRGVIVNREYHPSYVSWFPIPVFVGKYWSTIIVPERVEEWWTLRLRLCKGEGFQRKCQWSNTGVDRATYDQAVVGAYIDLKHPLSAQAPRHQIGE